MSRTRASKGFTLLEMMIYTVIIGIIFYAICFTVLWKGGHWVWSQSVSDVGAIQAVEDMGYTDVSLVESFRVKPEKVDGCVDADTAAFILKGTLKRELPVSLFEFSEKTEPRDKTYQLTVCCVGSWGKHPRCRVRDSLLYPQ